MVAADVNRLHVEEQAAGVPGGTAALATRGDDSREGDVDGRIGNDVAGAAGADEISDGDDGGEQVRRLERSPEACLLDDVKQLTANRIVTPRVVVPGEFGIR